MNREARTEKIVQIVERDKEKPYGKVDIPWMDDLVPMPVYQIPLDCLIYNKYNGRILSRTKSLESQGHKIDAESADGVALIEKLLMESNSGRNEQTLKSISKIGQEKPGIITRDGIVIDGNRRAMLIKRARKSDYFKTVVLDVTLEENPREIQKLETMYQMGADEKLAYNPIEKYLKAKELEDRDVNVSDIQAWMGETKDTVEEYLAVMETMDDYLAYLGYNGIYTQLDGREDPFINLTKWLRNFYSEKSEKAFDGYRDSDVDDLKLLSYDYIRARYEGKAFRVIAGGRKENHFFGDKAIWKDFSSFHFSKMTMVADSEAPIDYGSEDIKAHLDDRDHRFLEKTKNEKGISFLEENMDIHEQRLRYRKSAAEPLKLVNDAESALSAIDQRHKAASEPEVLNKVQQINRQALQILRNKSPERLLSEVIHILEMIEFTGALSSKDELIKHVKDIEKLAYSLEKKLKGL